MSLQEVVEDDGDGSWDGSTELLKTPERVDRKHVLFPPDSATPETSSSSTWDTPSTASPTSVAFDSPNSIVSDSDALYHLAVVEPLQKQNSLHADIEAYLPFTPRLEDPQDEVDTCEHPAEPQEQEVPSSPFMCVLDLDAVSSGAACCLPDSGSSQPCMAMESWQFLPDDLQKAYCDGLIPATVTEWFLPTREEKTAEVEDFGDEEQMHQRRRRKRLRHPRRSHRRSSSSLSYSPISLLNLDSEVFYEHASEQSVEIISVDEAQADVRRRAPAAHKSMSLAPNAQAAVVQNLHKDVAGAGGIRPKKSPGGGMVAADQEKVHVQTPGADRSALKDLPALRDAPPTKREELFVMKLQLCSVIFSFDDPTADKRGKDMKRQTLLELVDYVNTPAGQKIFSESIMGDLMAMVSANVCRALPPATDDFDPEEDEPVLEPAWPHLQVAYEFFLRFIVSSEVNAKAAKKYVDQKFCLQLVELFDSEDPRERDYLKTILHRIYGKFMSHRSFIRRAISNVFYRFVYETERHNGIGELLEILGSIINGFAIPLKKEHLQFLVRALIPLHKPKCVALYHQQLSYCIIQYVEKDADTATPILNGFFKCWPWSNSGKQVMFLNELEEILELLGADQLAQVSTMLFTNLARCLDSDHFQVVERALFLWNNEHLVNSGCLSRLNAHTVLPIIYGPLHKNSSGHWNATVEGLAQNVLKMYMEYDLALYDKCSAAYQRDEEDARKKLEALNEKWHAIEQLAVSKRPALVAS